MFLLGEGCTSTLRARFVFLLFAFSVPFLLLVAWSLLRAPMHFVNSTRDVCGEWLVGAGLARETKSWELFFQPFFRAPFFCTVSQI